ncbi:T9SS type A sorting domain-containing protein [Lacinutrix sp. C3R15]|uniref:T9SS type A sorting domain-containing protein n=1 Tax=Flavobacteriaceae TaxID=49546 RepID=UPI001C09FF76|nr:MULTISPECIES: T9SS type A sorting domain-containing protein [Flavobacteriaceae]MBU2938011.1 T9SS type A sorting domain-containing protein [Lacinutrix sp. C3R15]MDO6621325.1 T9SS type A sorting domain-containing protein [Oceanihabitans sp. 1_MG-2023]
MKKMYTFLLSIICMYQIHAQYTAIPDSAFEQFLINQAIDSEGTLDGQVLTSDVAIVNSLDVSYTDISDMTGIRDFTTLTSLSSVNNTNLIHLDVSGLTALQNLDLALNYTLESLNVTGCSGLVDLDIKISGLNSLDLSTCTSLENIDMYKSYLPHLDVSGLTSLTTIRANESYLQTLNVAGCTSLSNININETFIHSLDLSNNPALINFGVFDSNLQDLNVSNCINLERLTFRWISNLNTINLTNCTKINTIISYDGNTLTNLDTSNLIDIESFYLEGISVDHLDLSNSTNLTTVAFNNSTIGSLDLRNGNNTNITSFSLYNVDIDCASVDDEVFSTANWTNFNYSSVVFSTDCETLSTTENQLNTISMYPNPVVNNLHIGLKSNQILQEVTIVNLQGKQLLTTTNTTINLSNLSAGYYFALVYTDHGKTIKKIMKK